MAAIPDNFNNIKELKSYLIEQKRKKIKHTPAEIASAKAKVKAKKPK